MHDSQTLQLSFHFYFISPSSMQAEGMVTPPSPSRSRPQSLMTQAVQCAHLHRAMMVALPGNWPKRLSRMAWTGDDASVIASTPWRASIMPLAASCTAFDVGIVTIASLRCATSCSAVCASNESGNGSSASGNAALLHRDTLHDGRAVLAPGSAGACHTRACSRLVTGHLAALRNGAWLSTSPSTGR